MRHHIGRIVFQFLQHGLGESVADNGHIFNTAPLDG